MLDMGIVSNGPCMYYIQALKHVALSAVLATSELGGSRQEAIQSQMLRNRLQCGADDCAALTMSKYDALLITMSRRALTRSTCNMTLFQASMTAMQSDEAVS